jgi:hypothetical protein
MDELTQSSRVPLWCKGVLLAGMLLFAFYASTHMVAAGDTWVALACGRHFAEHGVDNVEPFSFNSHPAGPTEEQLKDWPAWTHGMIRYWHPTGWINQNWLTHLIFYKLASWFGSEGHYNYDTLVAWKFALYTLTVLCVFAIGKTIGAGDLLSALAACMGMVVGRSFFDIRRRVIQPSWAGVYPGARGAGDVPALAVYLASGAAGCLLGECARRIHLRLHHAGPVCGDSSAAAFAETMDDQPGGFGAVACAVFNELQIFNA